MSFVKEANVLKLALKFQGTAEGLSLADIEEEFTVSRRTAERMRNAVEQVFPQLTRVDHDGREHRWRLPSNTLGRLADVSAAEIAALDAAADLARQHAALPLAETLDALFLRLKATQNDATRRRNEPDIEALLEANAVVSRPGPRARIDTGVMRKLSDAILAGRKVRAVYRYRSGDKTADVVLHPYGFLLGHRNYLVALREGVDGFRNYVLANLDRLEILDAVFEKRRDFALDAYARRSFGVFQEEPMDVEWRFSPEIAADAREYRFHPDQEFDARADGSLTVRFRAGGLKEMAWHLLTWGDQVEVIKPPALRDFWQEETFAAAKRRLRPTESLDPPE